MGYIELFQGTPLLMQLFLAFFGLSLIGFDVPAWLAAGLALTLWTGAFLAEIWRGCVESISKGQWEASSSLAMASPPAAIFSARTTVVDISETVGPFPPWARNVYWWCRNRAQRWVGVGGGRGWTWRERTQRFGEGHYPVAKLWDCNRSSGR